jgi:hypothetical protein
MLMNSHWRRSVRNPLVAVVCLCLAGSVVSFAQSTKFKADQTRLQQEALAAQKAKGLTDDAVAAQYPAAQFQPVTVQKVAPGGSVSVAIAGKFPAGVAVLSERDGAVLSGQTLSAGSYSARLTVGPNEGPGFVKLWTFTPVSADPAWVPVAFIDSLYRFELKSANGYVVKVAPVEKTFTIVDSKNASVKYQAEFYKPGETTPFETLNASQTFSWADEPQSRLDITLGESTTSTEAKMEEIGNKMADPKLTEAQRTALIMEQSRLQQKMMQDMMKPDANKATDDFGCRLLQVYPGKAGAVEGIILCGKNFNGGELQTTGTMTAVR